MVTKYSAHADQAQQSDSPMGTDTTSQNLPTSQVHQGAFSMTAGGEVRQSGVARHQVSFDGTPGGTVLASLQKTTGTPSVELEPGNPASRTSVEVAIRMGLLERDVAGNLRNAGTAAPAAADNLAAPAGAPAAPEATPPVDTAGIFDAAEDSAFAAEMGNMPDHAYDGLRARVGHAVVMGQSLDAAADQLAKDLGVERSQAAETVQNTVWYFEQISNRAAMAAGVQADQLGDFRAFCEQNPNEFMQLVQGLTYAKDTSRIQSMARAWLATKG